MKKIDAVVIRETKYVALCVFLLSVLTQAVFLIIGKWDYTVLLGNLLSGSVGVLNFLLMGITVQNAVTKDEKDAATTMRGSQALRTFFIFVFVAIGVLLPVFNTWAVIIPIFFPRIAISLRPVFGIK